MEGVTGGPPSRPSGIRRSTQEIVAHLRALTQLEKELTRAELKRKGTMGGAGAGVGAAAGLLALYAVGFGLAAVTAALALVVEWWLALLIVFGALVLTVLGLLLVSRTLLRRSTPFKPEAALEEARRTRAALGGSHAE
jgi:hypothetical protein